MGLGVLAALAALFLGALLFTRFHTGVDVTPECQSAVDRAQSATSNFGQLQDQTLRDCSSVEEFTTAEMQALGSPFNNESLEESAHDVLAAYCDPLDPSLRSAPACEGLRRTDPDAFDRSSYP